MKLFQIEEPDGGPADPSAPGAAIGIDVCGPEAGVAFSVGGNAEILADREGFTQPLPVPGGAAPRWQELLEAAKARAERALARPVTHAVVVLADPPDPEAGARLRAAAAAAGIEVLRLIPKADLPAGSVPVLAAAALAEELAPRPE